LVRPAEEFGSQLNLVDHEKAVVLDEACRIIPGRAQGGRVVTDPAGGWSSGRRTRGRLAVAWWTSGRKSHGHLAAWASAISGTQTLLAADHDSSGANGRIAVEAGIRIGQALGD
jgi:hypothetical protein